MSTVHTSAKRRGRAGPPSPLRTPSRESEQTGGSFVEELQHAAHRDVEPVRTIVELVHDLVERLLGKVGIEEHAGLLVVLRNVRPSCARSEVRIEERGTDPPMPERRASL